MKLPKELTTVTPVSRFIALVLFLLLPIISFLAGMQYQGALILTIIEPSVDIHMRPRQIMPQPYYMPQTQVCTTDIKLCPDGSTVGRVGPNCDFAPCRTIDNTYHR